MCRLLFPPNPIPDTPIMLHLYQSNRLESLADMMLSVQNEHPLPNPLATEHIVVQSQGMRRYIHQFWARHLGIAANLQFRLPAGLAWQLMREAKPDVPEMSPFASEIMQWRLLQLFQSPEFMQDDTFACVRSVLDDYLKKGGLSRYHLAGQIADVFDQYLVYRPDWIEAWSAGQRVAALDAHYQDEQSWQAVLWRELDRRSGDALHRVQLWHTLMDALAEGRIRSLPPRLFVFGLSTLAPMYMALFQQIALHRDVHIFALNPCSLYWGDLLEPAQILQRSDEADLALQGHPLLSSWGKQGRDFFNALSEAEAHQEEQHQQFAPEPLSDSLLHSLQFHIQNLIQPDDACREGWRERHFAYVSERAQHDDLIAQNIARQVQAASGDADAQLVAQLHADSSLQIHSAHSPLRELQILKDQIRLMLQRNPSWQPGDIAVLTPNIEPYAPFIEAVFGQYSDAPLPYSIADVKLSRKQPALDAIAQTLEVLGSRFEVEKVLALLDNPTILAQWQLTRDDLPLLTEAVAQLNIRWGSDETERAQYGDNHPLFTWQQGLDRLVLGWMQPAQQNLWHDTAAFDSHPDHLPVFARFVQFVQFLLDTKHEWQTPATIEQWCGRLRHLSQNLLAPADDADRQAYQQWESALANWQAQADVAQFTEQIHADTACEHAQHFLHQSSEAGFLRGGITFCSMVPMRSLPFNAICLLGLNDGVFPRQTKAASFDLIAKLPQAGDRARRNDDRYLFLEAVLSARHILYLSYIGRDIRTDAERAPSTLLGELVDCIASLTDLGSQYLMRRWVTHHPLQAFSPRYFQDESSLQLFSTRQDFADALNQPQAAYAPFANQAACTAEPHLIEQNDLLHFWRNPVRYWLKHRLNWQSPYFSDALPSSEPFLPDQPRRLDNAYLTARLQHQDFADTAAWLKAQSLLPAGKIGELTAQDYAIRAAMLDSDLHSQALPHRFGTLHLGESSLHYQLQHNHADGQIFFAHQFLAEHNQHGKLAAADKIELLLHHLIYCAATPDNAAEPRQSQYIGLNQTCRLPPIAQADAQEALKTWLTAYRIGQNTPLPYFARVNWAAAIAYYAPNAKKQDAPPEQQWQDALGKAIEKYHGGFTGMAQEDYPEVKLVFGRQEDDTPPYLLPMFRTLTEQLFAPLAECLQVMKDV